MFFVQHLGDSAETLADVANGKHPFSKVIFQHAYIMVCSCMDLVIYAICNMHRAPQSIEKEKEKKKV